MANLFRCTQNSSKKYFVKNGVIVNKDVTIPSASPTENYNGSGRLYGYTANPWGPCIVGWKVDFTKLSKLHFENVNGIYNNSRGASCCLGVQDYVGVGHDSGFVKWYPMNFTTPTDVVLDVSDITGEYYICLFAMKYNNDYSPNAYWLVGNVWVE